jgi:hypothetical protein
MIPAMPAAFARAMMSSRSLSKIGSLRRVWVSINKDAIYSQVNSRIACRTFHELEF